MDGSKPTRRARTQNAREAQLIAAAVDLAEKQIREGTASSQIIAHYLKLGSQRERLEMEIRREEKKLIRAKTEQIESAKELKEIYTNAITALKSYSGENSDSEEDYDYE